jgi:hypothetical protein
MIFLTWYYMGRLDGRAPKLDLENMLIEEIKKMTSADYAAEAERCGASLKTRGQQVTQIGKNLMERGNKMASPGSKP